MAHQAKLPGVNLAARLARPSGITRLLIETLTPREREVMEYVLIGETNKQIAQRFKVGEMDDQAPSEPDDEENGAGSLVQLLKMHQFL
ncbi:hypothetical protein ASE04_06170 [Rhizobium sp. Root708]|uniref:LuxR C-terminal-related transcriptional regulator n=1 Tax=Rhizobium sp. Root708 TaxID=1736592 RepID=UPI0006F8F46B|nr:LuxR C-terminal-related transcriptional regulator [Rhizobium sp. Root708]KRB55287.1 hypothetical protein ASE04_06170 [Rhizobium sp. Root708]